MCYITFLHCLDIKKKVVRLFYDFKLAHAVSRLHVDFVVKWNVRLTTKIVRRTWSAYSGIDRWENLRGRNFVGFIIWCNLLIPLREGFHYAIKSLLTCGPKRARNWPTDLSLGYFDCFHFLPLFMALNFYLHKVYFLSNILWLEIWSAAKSQLKWFSWIR